ncbi:MAG: hypothetical protein KF773_27625 [Deltaproteobacteria bacterium]|nr:hypothetical protein [Deltaproteobacteria bacterium]MCW5803907.1 hypothetical protein [Deltaproteobacteria bacterium]
MSGLQEHSNGRSIHNLVDFVQALPITDQVELIRQIAPMILGSLDDDDRNALVSELNYAIARNALAAASR